MPGFSPPTISGYSTPTAVPGDMQPPDQLLFLEDQWGHPVPVPRVCKNNVTLSVATNNTLMAAALLHDAI